MSRGQQVIHCYARVKPLQNGERSVLTVSKREVLAGGVGYEFHEVFDEHASNTEIFNKTFLKMIEQGLDGFNACVLAYGQTSSGKTYTMKGELDQLGLIPLSVKELFRRVEERKTIAQIRVGYFEIYNENVLDLLSDGSVSLDLREDRKALVVANLTEEIVKSELDALKAFERGETKRKYADNNVNTQSSRSHAVFRIILDVVQTDFSTTSSQIHLIDLAGSEAIHKTKAEGMLRKEADNINRSLLALSNVIRLMSEKSTFINFRDSKLTRVLQPCLTSNGLCLIVCTIKQDEEALAQTINTLKFGVVAAKIKISLKKNIQQRAGGDLVGLELKEEREKSAALTKEVMALREQLERSRGELGRRNKELERIKHLLMKEEMEKISERETAGIYKSKYEEVSAKNNIFSAQTGNILEIVQRDRTALSEECSNYKRIVKNQEQRIAELEQNQKALIEKLNTFHREIGVLEQALNNKNKLDQTNKGKNQPTSIMKRTKQISFYEQQEPCILTINNVIKLDVKILEMKRQMMEYIKCNAALQEQVNLLTQQIKNGHQFEDHQNTNSYGSKRTGLSKSEEDVRELRMQLHRVRNQLQRVKMREKKHLRMLKEQSKHRLDEIDGFVAYVEREREKDHSQKHLYQVYTTDQDPDVY